MSSSIRLVKAQSVLMKALNGIFLQICYSATVSNIELSKDMRYLTCYVKSISPDRISDLEVLERIKEKQFIVIRDIKKHVSFHMPKIRFLTDAHKDRIDRVSDILASLREKELSEELSEALSEDLSEKLGANSVIK